MVPIPASITRSRPPVYMRALVLVCVFSAAFVTYLDRIAMGIAAPSIAAELKLTNNQLGYVFAVFAIAYAVFEAPSGWWSDRVGQRRTMTRIVAAWSVFTVATGLATNYPVLLITRAAFGAAEAGAFPTLSRSLVRWFPRAERTRAKGVMWMGARLGGAVSPVLASTLIIALGWRATFGVLGCVGVVWCVLYWLLYRDDPAEHPRISSAELAHINAGRAPNPAAREHTSWGNLLRDRQILALACMYFLSGYGYQFFVTWLPTYLMKEKHVTLGASGGYAAAPLAAGAVACVLGGALADWMSRRSGSVRVGRRAVAIPAYGLAALGFALAPFATSTGGAVLALSAAAAANDLGLSIAWTTCVELGGRHGATAGGIMNTASSLVAVISPVSAAWLLTAFGSFHGLFFIAALMYIGASAMWLIIDPDARSSPS